VPLTEEERLDIEQYAHLINSIAPEDTDFSDLQFLKPVLQNKRIVLLGEQLHSDGSTFLAKSRLVKFLHQELGYDVLCFESGLYDTWLMQRQFEKDGKLQPETALWPFWASSCQTEHLWQYVTQELQRENPVQLAGFDIQFATGDINNDTYKTLLTDYLQNKQITLSHYPQFLQLLNYFQKNSWIWNFKPSQDSIAIELTQIIDKINSIPIVTQEDEVYIRYLQGIKQWYWLVRNYPYGNPQRLHIRDSLMADNLQWLINSVYPDKKLIIWAANMHIMQHFYQNVADTYTSMGTYIKQKFPNNSFTVCFTSFGRINPVGQLFQTGSRRALEYKLHQLNTRYAFINFNELPDDSFLKKEIYLRVNQDVNRSGNWGNLIDGLFYIDTMQNIKYIE
jgi:erythromycin esterase-like protein